MHSWLQAFKYVPYGPIQEVVPYLVRRAEENSTLLVCAAALRCAVSSSSLTCARQGSPGVQRERAMIDKELKRRLFGLQ